MLHGHLQDGFRTNLGFSRKRTFLREASSEALQTAPFSLVAALAPQMRCRARRPRRQSSLGPAALDAAIASVCRPAIAKTAGQVLGSAVTDAEPNSSTNCGSVVVPIRTDRRRPVVAIGSAIERGSLICVYDEHGPTLFRRPRDQAPRTDCRDSPAPPSPHGTARSSSRTVSAVRRYTPRRRDGPMILVALSRPWRPDPSVPVNPHDRRARPPASAWRGRS